MSQRFCVVGSNGAGKSRLAGRLAEQRHLPLVDADAFYHRPGWQVAPSDEFLAGLRAALAGCDRGWVVDGSFADVAGDVESFVWLDYPRRLVMARLVRRTFWRVLTRRRLWHGNRETWRRTLSRDPQTSILLWTWTQHGRRRETMAAAAASSPEQWVRLRSPREAENWLAGPAMIGS